MCWQAVLLATRIEARAAQRQLSDAKIVTTSSTRQRLSRAHAIWTRRQILFDLVDLYERLLESEIYETAPARLVLVVALRDDELERVRIAVDQHKPVSLTLTVSAGAPVGAKLIPTRRDVAEESWLFDEPMSLVHTNQLLSLSDPLLPDGVLSFDTSMDDYVFLTESPLSDVDVVRVRDSVRQIGVSLSCFAESSSSSVDVGPMVTARQGRFLPSALRQRLERDEDVWREHRVRGTVPGDAHRGVFHDRSQCLIDGDAQGEVTLSELLCLYDTVNVIPGNRIDGWLQANKLDTRELLELAQRGHVRLVLPKGLQHYPSSVLADVCEAAPSALLLGRELAIRTLASNAIKDPLTYGPWDAELKAALLGMVTKLAPSYVGPFVAPGHRSSLATLSFDVAMSGTMGMLGVNPGARIADVLERQGLVPPRLELMLASAGVEWAMALGASYVPRSIGEYDETPNARAVGSIWSRSGLQGGGNVTDRMHTLVDGLLAVSSIPPLNIVNDLSSLQRRRFSGMAKRLLASDVRLDELKGVVDALNKETQVYERRALRLKKWKLDTLAVAALAKPIADAADAQGGYFTSVVAGWLYEHLKNRLPAKFRGEIEDLAHVMAGMCLAPSLDAVIVSRTRVGLSGNAG